MCTSARHLAFAECPLISSFTDFFGLASAAQAGAAAPAGKGKPHAAAGTAASSGLSLSRTLIGNLGDVVDGRFLVGGTCEAPHKPVALLGVS